MSNVKEKFVCMCCGGLFERSEKPSTHKTHGVDECDHCWSTRKGAQVVADAKAKRARISEHKKERLKIQIIEREAKKDALSIVETKTTKKRSVTTTKLLNRANDLHLAREIKSINEAHL